MATLPSSLYLCNMSTPIIFLKASSVISMDAKERSGIVIDSLYRRFREASSFT
jgi:hypothetical protein